MGNKIELFTKQIDRLLGIKVSKDSANLAFGEVYFGTIGIAISLYGPASHQVQAIEKRNAEVLRHASESQIINELHGYLQNMRKEIQSGIVHSVQSEAKGEVLADFVVMAKQALDGDAKDVAAVLACAALEDTLKKYAEFNGLDVYEKDMSAVVNALKSKGLIKGPRSKVLESFVTVRNKVFHAQWEKIEATEIHSIIAFVQEFLIRDFLKTEAADLTI
jgi:hypothetical protein